MSRCVFEHFRWWLLWTFCKEKKLYFFFFKNQSLLTVNRMWLKFSLSRSSGWTSCRYLPFNLNTLFVKPSGKFRLSVISSSSPCIGNFFNVSCESKSAKKRRNNEINNWIEGERRCEKKNIIKKKGSRNFPRVQYFFLSSISLLNWVIDWCQIVSGSHRECNNKKNNKKNFIFKRRNLFKSDRFLENLINKREKSILSLTSNNINNIVACWIHIFQFLFKLTRVEKMRVCKCVYVEFYEVVIQSWRHKSFSQEINK